MKRGIISIVLATALVLTMGLAPAVVAENNETEYIECHGIVLPEVVSFNIRNWANPDTFRIIVDDIHYDGLGWCADAGTRIESGPNVFFEANVYVSLCLESAPECVTERPWGSINWVLNNWRGLGYSSGDAQVAMWALIHEYDFSNFQADTGRADFWGITWNQDNVDNLVGQADPDFVPEPGELVAVVLLVGNLCPGYEVTAVPPFVLNRDPAKQMVFIELEKARCETAWGTEVDNGHAISNENWDMPGTGRAWGWNIGPLSEGEIVDFELWAAAGQNILANGVQVGDGRIGYAGEDEVNVKFILYDGFTLENAQLWVGGTNLPETRRGYTAAPGQFNFKDVNAWEFEAVDEGTVYSISLGEFDTDDGEIYVALHLDVCWFPSEINGD